MQTYYDLHCHLLPGMDDGCKTPAESLALMAESYRQGIRGMIATPHYHPAESVDSYIQRRQQSLALLQNAMQSTPEPLPQLLCGAEVTFCTGLHNIPQLNRLCLGGSGFLLIEFSSPVLNIDVFQELERIERKQQVRIILAHVERYLLPCNRQIFRQLFQKDYLLQINAEGLQGGISAVWIRTLIKQQKIQLIASDSHNLTDRKQNLGLVLGNKQSSYQQQILNNATLFQLAAGQR